MKNLIARYPILSSLEIQLYFALNLLEKTIKGGGKILICGNGGSAADAEHIVGELMKEFCMRRPLTTGQRQEIIKNFPEEGQVLSDSLQRSIPAISLVSGVSLPTAFGNDVCPVYVFAQQVFGLGQPGDLLWAISTSGNSQNVLAALRVARSFGLYTLGMTGIKGGKMSPLCDVLLAVPLSDTAEIQELHLPIYHFLCANLEKKLFKSDPII